MTVLTVLHRWHTDEKFCQGDGRCPRRPFQPMKAEAVATANSPDNVAESTGRWRALVLLAVAELLGMSLWFSASAVAPRLQAEWHLTESTTSWLTLSVQLGFVAGTLLSALLNLPDIISTRRLFAASAIAGAVVNACLGLFAESFGVGVSLRFLTGLFLAGVYPPGMKI